MRRFIHRVSVRRTNCNTSSGNSPHLSPRVGALRPLVSWTPGAVAAGLAPVWPVRELWSSIRSLVRRSGAALVGQGRPPSTPPESEPTGEPPPPPPPPLPTRPPPPPPPPMVRFGTAPRRTEQANAQHLTRSARLATCPPPAPSARTAHRPSPANRSQPIAHRPPPTARRPPTARSPPPIAARSKTAALHTHSSLHGVVITARLP